MGNHQPNHGNRPYKLITTSDPNQTLGEGKISHYSTVLAAANAFVKAPEPYKQIIHDDGREVRELTTREERLLGAVCNMLGYDLEQSQA